MYQCLTYLTDELNGETAFLRLAQTKNYPWLEGLVAAHEYILSHAVDVFSSQGSFCFSSVLFTHFVFVSVFIAAFLSLPIRDIKPFISSDFLAIGEYELYHCMEQWATNQCVLQGQTVCGTNKKQVLGVSISFF
jgi:hypothetical protein